MTAEEQAREIVNSMRDPLDTLSTNPNHWIFAIASALKQQGEKLDIAVGALEAAAITFDRLKTWPQGASAEMIAHIGADRAREALARVGKCPKE